MRKVFYLVFTVACLFIFSSSFAQTYKIFIKALDNNGVLVNGGSTAPGHTNQIETFSYSWGVSSPCLTGTCIPSISDYNIMLKMSGATTILQLMCVKGLYLSKVDVYYERPTPTGAFIFYTMHMEDVKITSLQHSGSVGGDDVPTVSASLFGKKNGLEIHCYKSRWYCRGNNQRRLGHSNKHRMGVFLVRSF
jgi:type VI protein secretion system component Hcp